MFHKDTHSPAEHIKSTLLTIFGKIVNDAVEPSDIMCANRGPNRTKILDTEVRRSFLCNTNKLKDTKGYQLDIYILRGLTYLEARSPEQESILNSWYTCGSLT